MSGIPDELRDRIVDRLEEGLEERDDVIRDLRDDIGALERAAAAGRADAAQANRLLGQLRAELDAGRAEARRETEAARTRLRGIEVAMDAQLGQLSESICLAERRHADAWRQHADRLASLEAARAAREAAARRTAQDRLSQASALLASLDPHRLDALDLGPSRAALVSTMDAANACRHGHPLDSLAAATIAHGDAVALARTASDRSAVLSSARQRVSSGVAALDALSSGAPTAGLPDQGADIAQLLAPERALFESMVSSHLTKMVPALDRWNGHAALERRCEAIRAMLEAEFRVVRRALPAGVAYDADRYALDDVWDALELRVGWLDAEAADIGAWDDPADRKSTYRHVLVGSSRDVVLEMPWLGDVVARNHEVELCRFVRSGLAPDVVFIGELRRRWQELAARLDTPNWNPPASTP